MDEDVSLVNRVTWHEVVGARFKSHESAVVTNVESREQVERLVFRKGLDRSGSTSSWCQKRPRPLEGSPAGPSPSWLLQAFR